MPPGDVWLMPGGHRAMEVSGSTRDTLRLSIIHEDWPWPSRPKNVVRALCVLEQRRAQATDQDQKQDKERN